MFGGGDSNIFAYVGGDPVNWVDPWGRYGVREGLGADFMYWFLGAPSWGGSLFDFDPSSFELSAGVYFQNGVMGVEGCSWVRGLSKGSSEASSDLAGISIGAAAGCEGITEASSGAAVPAGSFRSPPYVGSPRWGSDYLAVSTGPGFRATRRPGTVNWTHVTAQGIKESAPVESRGFRSSGIP